MKPLRFKQPETFRADTLEMGEYQLHVTHISMYSREMIASQKVKNKIKQTSKIT